MYFPPLMVLWLAQTSGGPSIDPVSQYSALGVAGLICGVLTIVWRQAEARANRAEAEVRELNRLRLEDQAKLIPLAQQMVSALGGATVALEKKESRSLDQTLSGIEEALADLRRKGSG